jgi:hypothetical protein
MKILAVILAVVVWPGGAHLDIGRFTIGYRTSFSHYGWWGKSLYAGHIYAVVVDPA